MIVFSNVVSSYSSSGEQINSSRQRQRQRFCDQCVDIIHLVSVVGKTHGTSLMVMVVLQPGVLLALSVYLLARALCNTRTHVTATI
jgi:hypothetical protein